MPPQLPARLRHARDGLPQEPRRSLRTDPGDHASGRHRRRNRRCEHYNDRAPDNGPGVPGPAGRAHPAPPPSSAARLLQASGHCCRHSHRPRPAHPAGAGSRPASATEHAPCRPDASRATVPPNRRGARQSRRAASAFKRRGSPPSRTAQRRVEVRPARKRAVLWAWSSSSSPPGAYRRHRPNPLMAHRDGSAIGVVRGDAPTGPAGDLTRRLCEPPLLKAERVP